MTHLAQPSSDPDVTPYEQVENAASHAGLMVMGALHPRHVAAKQLDSGTLILLGAGADFWPVLKASPEWHRPDPRRPMVEKGGQSDGRGARRPGVFSVWRPPRTPHLSTGRSNQDVRSAARSAHWCMIPLA